MNRTNFLAGALGLLLLASCTTSGLDSLVLDGAELHASLVAWQLDEELSIQVPDGLPDNPHLSTSAEFVEAISRRASQGQLGGEGIRAALFALYLGESPIGLYGLEAGSAEVADRLEGTLRGIWAFNVERERARVHRTGEVLVVVWHYGGAPACWDAVNASVADRLVVP